VPLAIAERVERPAEDVLALDAERYVEGAADGEHAQIAVKHEQGLTHRVNDGLREHPRIFDTLERFSHGDSRSCLRPLPDLSPF
jgi:hypothetical protein